MRKALRSRMGDWIDTLPPDHQYMRSRLYWRLYKMLPLVAGILFSITAILELVFSHSMLLLIVTAIGYIGAFWLIANLLVHPR